MPPDLAKKVSNFVATLAIEAGGAVDRDRPPPGTPMSVHARFSIHIPGEPVILEYTVHQDLRAIRIPVVVWID
ncbi:hypothetical protein [Streptomyces sp. Rer75]|uniref:hypothetical protein n=1 Tax=Streptomyces sp. Rer75 TaxID=2750011 RepID=UPI0015D00FA8|nr:hypothetical protein [Streptomyces sp. Rer75]QLH19401.1 hypothetical protein HYQ63_00865 [Streptomyces sp. Rer75]